MDDFVLRIRNLIENETRSCSMDFGCITPQYVYRMWGGNVAIETGTRPGGSIPSRRISSDEEYPECRQ